MIPEWIAVASGGALGAVLRYQVARYLPWPGQGIPLATLIVNWLGALLIGVVVGWLSSRAGGAAWRPFLVTGLFGALTTYSTFSLETVRLLQQGDYVFATTNALLTLCGTLAATFLGLHLAASL